MIRRAGAIILLAAAGFAPGLAGVAVAALLGDEQRQACRAAFLTARTGDYDSAAKAARGGDAACVKFVRWLELTRSGTGARFDEIVAFAEANPEWPGQTALRQRAEEAVAGVAEAQLRAFFQKSRPITPTGKLRYAELLIADGDAEAGARLVRDVWTQYDLSTSDEKAIIARFPGILRQEDHIRRLDRLVWDGADDAAKRMYGRVPPGWRALAEARLALGDEARGADRLLARVPPELQRDPGLLYERMRWRRRKDQLDGAVEIALAAPRDLGRPNAWAIERQFLARKLLAAGKGQTAYKMTAQPGALDGQAMAELEFLAGWIALRTLNDPKLAAGHFQRLYDGVKLPISLARGAYWAGRAAEAQKNKPAAAAWYERGAQHPTTYYGQLAHASLGTGAPPRPLPEPDPSTEDFAAFNRRELVRVARILHETNETDRLKQFVNRLSELSKTPVEHAMLATLAEDFRRLDLAVSVAKRAGYAGVPLTLHGYPVISMPGDGVAERALVLAMTRQESAFDKEAVSKAGARGLMQLMPATAKQVANQLSVSYSADRLLSDPPYNLQLGRAYLDGLLESFNNSYVLSVASYNAGPGRVRQWMREFGDPRDPAIDEIDWVETIPFAETRNYVQRVLENLQVYRHRLGDKKLAFTLTADLKR